MGIDNLLQFIKPALRQVHISKFKGKKVAVDALSWLYRGCYACALDLNQNIQTNDFLYFLQKMINMMLEYQVEPILVFDGRNLKAKEKTEQRRKNLKGQNLQKAQELQTQGNHEEAKKYYQRCLKITKKMLYQTFDVLRQIKIEYIVAPYEADVQLAYLCKIGYCEAAVTEDSDLVCYMCPHILFKLQNDGMSQELELGKLRQSKQFRAQIIDEKNGDLRQFFAFKEQQIIDVCILSGCDYLPSIQGVGIRKAVTLMDKLGSIYYVMRKLQQNNLTKDRVPKDYFNVLCTIRLIFQFQIVYNPLEGKQIPFNQDIFDKFIDEQNKIIEMEEKQQKNYQIDDNQIKINPKIIHQIIGSIEDPEIAKLFSAGEIDFKTMQKREPQIVDFNKLFLKSLKNVNYKIQKDKQKQVSKPESQQNAENFEIFDNELIENNSFHQNSSIKKNMQTQGQNYSTQKISINEAYEDIQNICDELLQEFSISYKKLEIQEIPQKNQINPVQKDNNPFKIQSQTQTKKSFSLNHLKTEKVRDG